MTKTDMIVATWTVVPLLAPQPVRHCPTCATTHPFASSGRVRLNANGKRLDAWLIYKCTECDQTWNRPLLDRKPVSQISPKNMDAMQQSAPAWVWTHAFNVADLKKHCAQIHHPPDFKILKQAQGSLCDDWSEINLTLMPQAPLGVRVDKILCSGWHMSRSDFQRVLTCGALKIRSNAANVHRKPLRSSVSVQVRSPSLSPQMRRTLVRGLAP